MRVGRIYATGIIVLANRNSFVFRSVCFFCAFLMLQGTTASPTIAFIQSVSGSQKIRPMGKLDEAAIKGLPVVQEKRALIPAHVARAKMPQFRTQLDQAGGMDVPITNTTIQGWKSELKRTGLTATRQAQLNILIGEAALGEHNPSSAELAFGKAIKLAPKNTQEAALARYDKALSLFFQGRYGPAADQIEVATSLRLLPIRRQNASLILKHARLCQAYHKTRAEAGIVEPGRVDPLCGVAGIAIIAKHFGLRFDEPFVKSKVRFDGQGSTVRDLIEGSKNLALSAHSVDGSPQTLKKLFACNDGAPIIAHVEKDHFITVLGASKDGVRYNCSDCGEWPGGEQSITWKQWRLLDCDLLLSVNKKDSELDSALAGLSKKSSKKSVFAMVASQMAPPSTMDQQLKGVYAIDAGFAGCGGRNEKGACKVGSNTPTAGGAINLVTLAEEHHPAPDLVVYNPKGPSIVWARNYGGASTYASEFGDGWSHPYNVGIEAMVGETAVVANIVLANGSKLPFSLECAAPDEHEPVRELERTSIAHCKLYWKYDSGTRETYFEVLFPNRTSWKTGAVSGAPVLATPGQETPFGGTFLPIVQMADGVGNFITLEHDVTAYGTMPGETEARLTEIKDCDGSTLLTINRTGSHQSITSVVDCYSRKVIYDVDDIATYNFPYTTPQELRCLTDVSVVVSSASGSGAARWQYHYSQVSNGEIGETFPTLDQIKFPNLAGSGMATRTLHFVSGTFDVEYEEDTLGNEMHIEKTDEDKTKVTFITGSTIILNYGVQYDTNGELIAVFPDFDPEDTTPPYLWMATLGDASNYHPAQIVDGNGHYTSMYRDTYGHLANYVTNKGTETVYTYDDSVFPIGLLESIEVEGKAPTTFEYYSNGQLQYVHSRVPGDTSGTPVIQATSFTYNAFGDIESIITPGNNSESTHEVTFDYGMAPKFGEPLTITNSGGIEAHFTYDSRGNVIDSWDNDTAHTSTRDYNLANQLTSAVLPATGTSGTGNAYTLKNYMYVGGPIESELSYDEDATLIRTTNFDYDSEGRMLERSGSAESVAITYDAVGHAIAVQDGLGSTHETTYDYDVQGRLTHITNPNSGSSNYDQVTFTDFDGINRPETRIDGNNHTTTYEYDDDDGLLSDIHYSGASGQDIAIEYDDYDRVVSVTDGTGVGTTTYDDLDLVMSATRDYSSPNNVPSKSVDYTYYPDGSRETMVNPAGTWTYLYNESGAFTSSTSPLGTTEATYFDNGWQESRTLPNGSYTLYEYNNVGALSSLINKKSDGTVRSTFDEFGYDGVFNNLGFDADYALSTDYTGTKAYEYDSKDRLTSEARSGSGSFSFTFAYDAAGNPTTFKGSTRTYNIDNQRTSSSSYVYDGNGNPTTYAGSTLAYDRENRLTTAPSFTAGYRADGLRAYKGSGLDRRYFLYDGGNVVCELTANGSVASYNDYAPDGLVARMDGPVEVGDDDCTSSGLRGGSTSSLDVTGETLFLFDPQGSVAHRLGTTEGVLANSHYDAYGVESVDATVGDPFGYNAKHGYYLDRETGLYLCQHRYYDPGSGRWLTRDPMGFSGGVNVYGYCGGGPVGWMDASGFGMSSVDNPEGAAALADLAEVMDGGVSSVSREALKEAAKNAARRYGPGLGTAAASKLAEHGEEISEECSVVGEELSGQVHHAISNPILRALQNVFNAPSSIRKEFLTQAQNLESHNGWEGWHRRLDAEFSERINSGEFKTLEDFLEALRKRYAEDPDLRRRFPNGL